MSLFWFRPTPDHPWFTTVALILLSGVSTTQAADQAKAKKSDKKPGNATVDKTTAKEKKQLSKVLEQLLSSDPLATVKKSHLVKKSKCMIQCQTT